MTTRRSSGRTVGVVVGVAFLVVIALVFRCAATGGMTARQPPSKVEGWIAGKLVESSAFAKTTALA